MIIHDIEWFHKLATGDKVILRRYGSMTDSQYIGVVDRFTRTQVVIKVGSQEHKFNRASGYEVGTNIWNKLEQWTEEKDLVLRNEVFRKNLVRRLEHMNWNTVSIETLTEVKVILDRVGL